MVLDEFLQDFAECELVDGSKGAKPADLLPDLLKYTLPIHHLLEFVLDVSLFLHFYAFALHVLANLL